MKTQQLEHVMSSCSCGSGRRGILPAEQQEGSWVEGEHLPALWALQHNTLTQQPSVNPLNLGRRPQLHSAHDVTSISAAGPIQWPRQWLCVNNLMSNSAPSGEPVECFLAWVGLLELFVGWCNRANEAVKAAGCCGGSTCRDTLTRSHILLRVSWLWLWCERQLGFVCYEGLERQRWQTSTLSCFATMWLALRQLSDCSRIMQGGHVGVLQDASEEMMLYLCLFFFLGKLLVSDINHFLLYL